MVGLKQLERDGNVMTKRVINIKLEENGNVKLENWEDNNIIVTLQQKQLNSKQVFALLDYKTNDKYTLNGDEKYSSEEISGPKNEKFRLYNYVYEYIDGLIKEIDDLDIK